MRRLVVPFLLLVIVGLGVALAVVLRGAPVVARVAAERPPPPVEAPAPTAAPAGPRPNVVLLVLDTLRADHVGFMNPRLPPGVSPELDAFAKAGVRFERAITQASWTRPSVGSLLTSRYPRELGVYKEQWDRLPERESALAEVLHEAGYRTVGLTANPNLNRAFNFHQGFDVYVDSNVVFNWMGAAPTDEVLTTLTRLRSAREIFQLALQLIQSRHAGPTYLQIDVMEMHEARGNTMFRPGSLQRFVEHPDHRYLAMLRQLSLDVGAFIRQLMVLPGWQDTLFVVTSDHGEGLNSHPNVEDSRYHGPLLYESQCWVPLFLFNPGDRLPRNAVVEHPVRLLDVMPTVLSLVGVPAPPGLEGKTLTPLFGNVPGAPANAGLPDYFVVETYWREREKVGVYSADFKYIENRKPHGGTRERELQPNRILENGTRTDVGDKHPDLLDVYARYLAQWEQHHAKAEPEDPSASVPAAEAAQLKALGYVQ